MYNSPKTIINLWYYVFVYTFFIMCELTKSWEISLGETIMF